MSEIRRTSHTNNQPMPPRSFRRKMAATVAGTGMLVGAASGAFVMNKIDSKREHNANPACAVSAGVGDSLSKIKTELGSSDGVQIWVTTGRDAPFKRNEKNTRNFYNPNTSSGLQAGDEVVVDHVNPKVCMNVGGVVLNEVTPHAIVEASVDQRPISETK